MEMEQMMAYLMAEIRTNREEMRAGQELLKEDMLAKIDANQKKMEGRIHANNEKFEVLRGSLVSRMDIHQARTVSTQEEMKAKMDIHQEKVETTIHSVRSQLEEIIKYRVEDVLSCVDQRTQGLRKELREKTEETRVDVRRYANKEPPGSHNEHQGALSGRALHHVSGRGTDNTG
jgi:hypothetical protein